MAYLFCTYCWPLSENVEFLVTMLRGTNHLYRQPLCAEHFRKFMLRGSSFVVDVKVIE